MTLKTLVTVCAELAVLAAWVVVGLAANRSLDEHEAKRKAQSAGAETPQMVLVKNDDKRVNE